MDRIFIISSLVMSFISIIIWIIIFFQYITGRDCWFDDEYSRENLVIVTIPLFNTVVISIIAVIMVILNIWTFFANKTETMRENAIRKRYEKNQSIRNKE